MTKAIMISIKELKDIYDFVTKAQKVEGDITISRGRYAVDAKSILGIFSIDISQGVIVTYPASAEDFEKYIEKFKVDR